MKYLIAIVLVGAAGSLIQFSRNPVASPPRPLETSMAMRHTIACGDGGVVAGTDSTLTELLAAAIALNQAARAAGGLEMGTVAFHEYPGVPMGSVYSYPVKYAKVDSSGTFEGVEGIIVDVRPHAVMTKGVVESNVVQSQSVEGLFDVRVRFNRSIPDYAKQKQIEREAAYAANIPPDDQGIALIHNGFMYSDFTYGEIHAAITSGDGWVTIVRGTSLDEAMAIASGLSP